VSSSPRRARVRRHGGRLGIGRKCSRGLYLPHGRAWTPTAAQPVALPGAALPAPIAGAGAGLGLVGAGPVGAGLVGGAGLSLTRDQRVRALVAVKTAARELGGGRGGDPGGGVIAGAPTHFGPIGGQVSALHLARLTSIMGADVERITGLGTGLREQVSIVSWALETRLATMRLALVRSVGGPSDRIFSVVRAARVAFP
jgi:hypothetical protein